MEHGKKVDFLGSTMTRTKKSFMVKHMRLSSCNISYSCREIGISRTTHFRWMKSDDTYKSIIDELLERSLDLAESVLFKHIASGNIAATIFHLKCKGKDRGYYY